MKDDVSTTATASQNINMQPTYQTKHKQHGQRHCATTITAPANQNNNQDSEMDSTVRLPPTTKSNSNSKKPKHLLADGAEVGVEAALEAEEQLDIVVRHRFKSDVDRRHIERDGLCGGAQRTR